MFAVVDANNFFASCERVFRPDLANKPVVVLSSNDGCVVARSQEVRDLGIQMGVPYFQVKHILAANDVQIFSSNFRLYSDMSQRMLQMITDSVPEAEVYSVDEAFVRLDHLSTGQQTDWAQKLRQQIDQSLGLPVSIGIAPTKTLAKIASHAAKHTTDGVHRITDDNRLEQLAQTPLSNIWGIGRRLTPKLMRTGLKTAADLAIVDIKWADQRMGKKGVQTVMELRGQSCIPLEINKNPPKSIMVSRAFGHRVRAHNELESAVTNFVSKAAAKLRRHQIVGGAIALHLYGKYADESIFTRVYTTLSPATSDSVILTITALNLLSNNFNPDIYYKKAGILLFDIRLGQYHQIDMLRPDNSSNVKRKQLMSSLDAVNRRWGEQTLYLGTETKSPLWQPMAQRRSPDYTRGWSDLPLVY